MRTSTPFKYEIRLSPFHSDRPPMEVGMSPDRLWVRLKPTAPLGLDLFQLIQGGEDPIGQRLVGKRPEPLGGLHLGGIRWQEHQVAA